MTPVSAPKVSIETYNWLSKKSQFGQWKNESYTLGTATTNGNLRFISAFNFGSRIKLYAESG